MVVLSVGPWTALGTTTAHASDEVNGNRVLATELFKEGRTLLAEKQFAEACRKLEESQRLDPGGGTLLNLALCHELEGRTATAWSEFHEALGIARRDGRADREEQAQRHIDSLEPLLARLVIAVPPEARVHELVVRRDGNVIGEAAWEASVPIDPGQHVVEARSPGRVAWSTSIQVPEKGAETVEIPILEALPVPVPPPGPPHAAPAPAPKPWSVPPGPSGSSGWQRPSAIVLGGLGSVGLALSVIFGLQARRSWDIARPRCLGECDAQGIAAWSDAKNSATASTIAFVFAGLAVAGGVVLWVTAPSPATSIGIGGSGGVSRITIAGEF